MAVELEVEVKRQFYFEGVAMLQVREQLNLTQDEFAKRCGWTQPYQKQIEMPGLKHHLTETIQEGLKKLNIKISGKED